MKQRQVMELLAEQLALTTIEGMLTEGLPPMTQEEVYRYATAAELTLVHLHIAGFTLTAPDGTKAELLP